MDKLADGERLLWKGQRALADSLGDWLFGLLLLSGGIAFQSGGAKGGTVSIFVLPIAIGYLMFVAMRHGERSYTVTDRRALVDPGAGGSRVSEIQWSDLREIRLRRTLSQRIVRLGTLELVANDGSVKVTFEGISSPQRVKELLESAAHR